MLAGTRHHTRARRGIVLVLVLAMLGLLALIGVTFATFSGQARINARNYFGSVVKPQDDELMDFALQQLITDTADPRSAIRGHSLARDMFGTDANFNGYIPTHPTYGGNLYITGIQASTTQPGAYIVSTNIAQNDSNFFGYNFNRWIIRVAYNGTLTGPTVNSPYQPPNAIPNSTNSANVMSTVSLAAFQPVYQTMEVIGDSQFNPSSNTSRTLTVALLDPYPGTNTSLTNQTQGGVVTNRINWGYQNAPGSTPAVQPAGASQLPIYYMLNAAAAGTSFGQMFPCVLDGRWLHAFNGPGMGANAYMGNFRYNGLSLAGATAVGMDEDYDACDLENWFLAIQSGDGQVVIPSFHRPGVIRHDPANGVDDWTRINMDNSQTPAYYFSTSASRILRPCQADGNDQTTFPDLIPDKTTGKITYDVDNDGDGATDSVWVDLGYPARRDNNGNLYKPLFAFMVIGLNGRIPLNTAGNLAGNGATHAQHLGNSVSEIDPQYALQNAFNAAFAGLGSNASGDLDPYDSLGTQVWPPSTTIGTTTYSTYNTQVDNSQDNATTIGNNTSGNPITGGLDVRLTQLRNLLAGTRPQTNPLAPTLSNTNGDANTVYGSWGTGTGTPYYLPNGIVDGADASYTITDPTSSNVLVQNTQAAVAGRWGEASSIPGVTFYNPNQSGTSPTYLNLIQSNYSNPVRAGYSFDVADLLTNATYGSLPFPRDAADDNYNAFDVYPSRLTGEVGDAEFYDAAGALFLPIDRMRRFVTPADINGTGRVAQFLANGNANIARGSDIGPDNYGRVQFYSYYRPPGNPGTIGVNYEYTSTPTPTYTSWMGWQLGATYYPQATPPSAPVSTNPTPNSNDPYYSAGPNPGNLDDSSAATSGYPYLADRTNNPFHGFESYKLPNLFQNPGSSAAFSNYSVMRMGGMPIDQNALTTAAMGGSPPSGFNPPSVPVLLPTYDNAVNSQDRTDGVNEADEMNLYAPNPLLDSPYGPSDLEWLYRQQDVDGATMTSRLGSLAPVSFTNTIDGPRRRRLVALDSWESNNFVWTNDNPAGAFANNSRFSLGQNASFLQAGLYTPTLAHRDKKINLNYPLPVSNDCNEPVRQKWISDTYQLLKVILPPDSVDTAEELAQLSQFVINIVDFRDPDATMTHWINPDVFLTPGTMPTSYPTLTRSYGSGNLDQYGMEYNPVAINEVLAYSFQSRLTANSQTTQQTNRFFIELVNTLTAAYNAQYDYGTPTDPNNYYQNQASTVNLGGFNYIAPGAGGQTDPYGAGCWDLVFTTDDAWSRPDPYRGELVYNSYAIAASTQNYYSLIPLTRDSFSDSSGAPNNGDLSLIPVSPNPPGNANAPNTQPVTLPATQTTPPTTYFCVIADPSPGTTYEMNSLSTSPLTAGYGPSITRTLATAYDPTPQAQTTYNASGTPTTTIPNGASPNILWRQGILPGVGTSGTQPGNFAWKLPTLPLSSPGAAKYYWVCLRRPANPFAPVSATNPMCVVDAMRFPYIDGSGTWSASTDTNGFYYMSGAAGNTIYSAQRLQPYRGGHAVPIPNMPTGTATTLGAIPSIAPPDARYGYTEQICGFNYNSSNNATYYPYGIAAQSAGTGGGSSTTYPSTTYIQYHTLGQPNSSAEIWDYFVFNDRDFTSPAELMMVPGCPPGLFTKQFAEFAPSQINAANIFSQVTPIVTPTSNTSKVTQSLSYASPPVTLKQFNTATAPFYDVSQATPYPPAVTSTNYTAPAFSVPSFRGLRGTLPTGGSPSVPTPIQPHSFPYLVDKFFYTGASTFYYPPTGGVTDPSALSQPVVGGPGGDGWFKMFEFFEVPSQANGSYGPVYLGANFDWLRQDIKPGLMNLNLIIDEEAFFAVFGRQNSSYTQTLLNGIELPNWPNVPYLQPAVNSQGQLPLTNCANSNGQPIAPIQYGYSPIPLVVTALQANGAPNYVFPLTSQGSPLVTQGYVATDPIQQAINLVTYSGQTVIPPGVGNRMKAAFAQFLWLRHGGSGYIYGFGPSYNSGQNTAVNTAGQLNINPLPADRPFRSLSYPDINYTIMRPASLPPSTFSNPAMLVDPKGVIPAAVYNAATTLYVPESTTTLPSWYFLNAKYVDPFTSTVEGTTPNFYAPYVTGNTYYPSAPAVYTGDPGVRNPFINTGYATVDPTYAGNPAYPTYPTQANSVPAGVPLPTNVAFPGVGGNTTTTMDSFVMPPPIPAARLFQAPDAYGAGGITIYGYDGLTVLPPPVSNATDSGDPWINNQIANTPSQTMPAAGTYALNNGFPSLVWPWMSGAYAYNAMTSTATMTGAGIDYGATGQTTPPPPNPATGVLPLIQPVGAPTTAATNANNTGSNANLSFGSSTPYLGSVGSPGSQSLTNTDDRQHPYWRSEQLQRAMNLTTVRTHQFAVWITIGFFEVKRQGDTGMLFQGAPQLAFDIMGPEVGALNGQTTRYRGFFLVDRLRLTGFDPANVGAFHNAIVYRKVIQ